MADLLRAYLIVGTDELKRNRAVARLKGRLEAGLEDFNLDEFTAGADIQGPELVASAQTMPFGPGFRLVVVHNANKLSKGAADALTAYLKDPNPNSVLCLESEKFDKHDSKLEGLYLAIEGLGKTSVLQYDTPRNRELHKRVQTMAKQRGLSITLPAAAELVERAGESTVLLDNQLASLAEFIGNRTRIDVPDIRAYVARTAAVRPWTIMDALFDQKTSQAIKMWRVMVETAAEPDYPYLVFLAYANSRVRELIQVHSLLERNAPIKEILKALRKREEWQIKNQKRWALSYGSKGLARLLSAGRDCERALKDSDDDETAMIRYLMSFVR